MSIQNGTTSKMANTSYCDATACASKSNSAYIIVIPSEAQRSRGTSHKQTGSFLQYLCLSMCHGGVCLSVVESNGASRPMFDSQRMDCHVSCVHAADTTRAALKEHFKRIGKLRSWLGLTIIASGGVGFVISHLLLHFDLPMWLRYPIAVCAAYLAFLGLLLALAEFVRTRAGPQSDREPVGNEIPAPKDKRKSIDPFIWLQGVPGPPVDNAGEVGCAILVAGFIVSVLLIVLPWVLGFAADIFPSASGVVADMFIDAALMALLYGRLKRAGRQRCLSLAIRRTWILVLTVAITLSIAGAVIQAYYPHAKSIGDLSR
jgi:hypothetical protein